MSQKVSEDKSDSICVVCCRRLTIYAIGECDHPVCYQCATRMRVLYDSKQNDCAICRKELPKMIFCHERVLYKDLKDMHFTLKDAKHKLYFVDIDIQKAFYKLLEHQCQFCDKHPTYGSFHALKDHIRKEHERHFCDLCVEHLMIFTFERKCYTRPDLARHRRVGDADDTSHRGHPLCEFCDKRFLDDDELYKHLRREHFFCHFCDADGLHHYYSDYEYLREHFRKEHFLCEEEDCAHEKFTTVFRTEIDLKAHRSTVHNKNLSKAQMKQTRTIELEFNIAPRSSQPRNGRHNREGRDNEAGSSRDASGFRRGYRRGDRGDDQRNKRHAEDVEPVGPVDRNEPEPVPNIDMNDSKAFPSLGLVASASCGSDNPGNPNSGSPTVTANNRASTDTMAQKIAKINRFTVGNRCVNGDEEFPALVSNAKSSYEKNNKPKPSSKNAPSSWGASASATVVVNTSGVNITKNTLTFKLSSKEEFPGLQKKNRQSGTPAAPSTVSFNMTHSNQAPSKNKNKTTESLSSEVNNENRATVTTNSVITKTPVVTKVTSTQNITFLDVPTTSSNVVQNPENDSDALSRTDSGWYVLKKGKASKSDKPHTTITKTSMNVSSKDEFPELGKSELKMRFKEATDKPPISSAWKVSYATDSVPEPEGTESKSGKKKKNQNNQVNNIDQSSAKNGSNHKEIGKKKKKSNPSTFEKLKKLIETHSQDLLNDEEDIDGDAFKTAQNHDEPLKKLTNEDWPEIGEPITSNHTSIPPPGFQKMELQKSLNPPPGFSGMKKPPPGFRTPLSTKLSNDQPETSSITFTNSIGEDFALAPYSLNYLPLPEFEERNKILMGKIVGFLGADKCTSFLETSRQFRSDEISASEYYKFCVNTMGKEEFLSIFTELLVLLPDIGKQQELLGAYNEFNRKSTKNKTENALLFLICSACKQVLCSRDFSYHEHQHAVQ